MDQFYSKLKYRMLNLCTAEEMTRFGFLVQPSILPLNLEVYQPKLIQYPLRIPDRRASNDTINTEEKCRKLLGKNRNLLYTLHLDLPRDLELSLKSDVISYDRGFGNRFFHLGKIRIHTYAYFHILCRFLKYALMDSANSVKLFKWFIQLDTFSEQQFQDLGEIFFGFFVDCVLSGFYDTEFVEECFRKLSINVWLRYDTSPEKVEKFLFRLNQDHKNIDFNSPNFSLVRLCFMQPQFVGAALKFQNAPVFDDSFHMHSSRSVLRLYGEKNLTLRRSTTKMDERKRNQVLHLFWIYWNRMWPEIVEDSVASHFLRLIWLSIPDSFLTFEEIRSAYDMEGTPIQFVCVYGFYTEAVGKYRSISEPRSLKHFCRCFIRRRLWENEIWLPEGIRKLGLAKRT